MNDLQYNIVKAMGYHLMSQSSRLAFIQSRVSAESFVRDECSLAASIFLADLGFNVHMEKKAQNKKVDIIIVPTIDKIEDWDDRYLFELKMAWPGSLGECSKKIRSDFRALVGKSNAWVIVLYFAFTDCPQWMPYGKRKHGFEDGLINLITRIDHGDPDCYGPKFQMSYENVKGKAQLLGWRVD